MEDPGSRTMMRAVRASWVPAALLLLAATELWAQPYPSRPVRLVVPFVPGGTTDIVARIVAEQLQQGFMQNVLVDNRGGAGGNTGAEIVARSAPDGHTILLTSPGPQVINQFLHSKLPYDPQRDFSPVLLVTRQSNVLTVHPSVPAQTVAEFIERARAKPGSIKYSTGGSGTSAHLAAVLLASQTKIDLVHIPYRGTGPALQALLAGEVEMMFNSVPAVLPFIKAGKLNALGVSTLQRTATLPAVPPIAGVVPGFEASSWLAIMAPAKTPAAAIAALNDEGNRMLVRKEVRERLEGLGADPAGGTPAELGRHLADETVKWKRIVQLSGAKAD